MLNRMVTCILAMVLCLFLGGCGQVAEDHEDRSGLHGTGFQDNGTSKPYSNFILTEIFRGWSGIVWPGLEEMWDSIDAKGFNDRFSGTVNSHVEEFITFNRLGSSILGHPSRVVILLAGTDVAKLLAYLTDPSENYPVRDPANSEKHYFHDEGEDYTEGLYSFLDQVFVEGQNPGSTDMVSVNHKILKRLSDRKTADELHEDMEDLIADLLDPDFRDDVIDATTMLGKLLVRADYPLSADDESLGIGNAAKGVVDLLMWYNRMEQDPETRALMRSQVTEAVSVFDPSPDSENKYKIKQLLENIRDYFTLSGLIYSSSDPGNMYRKVDNDEIYSDTEISGTLRELFPGMVSLMMRSDRLVSPVDSKDGENVYVLKKMAENLNAVGYDPDTLNMETTLMNMMKYDCLGRDRTDPASGAYPSSHLESLIFVTHVTGGMGWNDRNGVSDDEVTEPTDPRYDHGHGSYTGRLSLNDSLFSIRTHKTMNSLGMFDISLKETDGNDIHRSVSPFSTNLRENYTFFFNQNYDVLNCLAPPCVGDLGTPAGGNPDGGQIPMNGFQAYSPDGLGETQLAAWTLGLVTRACFNGEGPYYYADPNAKPFFIGNKQWFAYYRPNGKIYAFVNKSDPENWEYFYPMDDGDPIDNDPALDGKNLGEYWPRYNRYKSRWNSDYYMVHFKVGKQQGGVVVYEDRFVTVDNSSGNTAPVFLEAPSGLAKCLTYNELIPENEMKRACSSPEEALFRNYQWVMTEKKMAIILPLRLDLALGSKAALFQILEGNGISGLSNLRKFRGNHYWAKTNTDGTSNVPGDYRIEVVSSSLSDDSPINDFNVYYETLDCGHATPTIVGANLPALVRLGFPRYTGLKRRATDVQDNELGSGEIQLGSDTWQNRSALLAPFISLVAALREYTPSPFINEFLPEITLSDNTLKRGIHMFVEGTSPLLKPVIYYQKDKGQHPFNTWKPLVTGSEDQGDSTDWDDYVGDDFLRSSADFHTNKTAGSWNGTEQERRYYQPATMKNLLNILIDSDITAQPDPVKAYAGSRMNGVLPVMMANNSISRLLKVLLSKPNQTDLMYSALEQIMGAVRITKGRYTELNETPEKNLFYPDYLFVRAMESSKGHYGEYLAYDKMQRPEDIVLDIGIDRLIGRPGVSDTYDGYGLVTYVDEQRDKEWEDLYDTLDFLEDILHPSSSYSVVESVLSMNEKVFGRERLYSETEIRGLTYALGKLLTHYDIGENSWLNQGEEGFDDLLTILQVRLPDIHDLMKNEAGYTGDHYKAALTLNADMMKPDGPVDFLVKTMETEVGWETLFSDSLRFVESDLVRDDEPMWVTFAALLDDLALAVDNSKDGSLMDKVYQDFGFQRND